MIIPKHRTVNDILPTAEKYWRIMPKLLMSSDNQLCWLFGKEYIMPFDKDEQLYIMSRNVRRHE